MKIRKIWESNLSLILLLWIVIAAFVRSGWIYFFTGVLAWSALVYLTATGVFWTYLALLFPNSASSQRLLAKAVSFKPLIPSPYLILGLNYIRSQKWDQAIPLLQKAIEHSPQRKKAQNMILLGRAYHTNNLPEKALAVFEELLQNGLTSMEVYNNLALIYLKLNQLPKALEFAKKARAGNLTATEPVLIQAKIYFLMGDYQQAKDDYQWVIKHLNWPVESFYWLGRAEFELHETEAAITHLQTAVKRITDDPLLADVSKEEAEEWLNRALAARN